MRASRLSIKRKGWKTIRKDVPNAGGPGKIKGITSAAAGIPEIDGEIITQIRAVSFEAALFVLRCRAHIARPRDRGRFSGNSVTAGVTAGTVLSVTLLV
jgi:hypothetical protein